jgi:thymidine kinase
MSLKLILGCMYSGKTTEILRIVNSLKHINEIPIIIKPKIDDRYSSDKISTHNKQEYKCQTIENLSEFKNLNDVKYIIIEEAQFFKDLLLFVIDQVEIKNKNVIVVGLDGDSDRENFGEIHKLYSLCDDIIKLKAYCSICKDGTLGIFSKRISDSKDKVLVGSEGDYIAVCRKCYLS